MLATVMAAFLFWNIDSLHGEADDRPFGRLIGTLAETHAVDVIVLVECSTPAVSLLPYLGGDMPFAPVASHDRFKLLSRFNLDFFTRVEVPPKNDRVDMWRLALPLQDEILLA